MAVTESIPVDRLASERFAGQRVVTGGIAYR